MSTILQKYFAGGAGGQLPRPASIASLARRSRPRKNPDAEKKCVIYRVSFALGKKRVRRCRREAGADDVRSGPRRAVDGGFRAADKTAATGADFAKLRGFFPAAEPGKEKVRAVFGRGLYGFGIVVGAQPRQPSALSRAWAKASMSASVLVSVVQASSTLSMPG